jgi:hypothetical protein
MEIYYFASASLEFEEFFELESTESEEHVTPWGAVQHFTWVTLRRKQR